MSWVSGIQLRLTSSVWYLSTAVAPAMFATRLPWVSITPLGSLVDPDENWMNARSSGAGRTILPGREMSVMDSTRKQRDLSSS